MRLRIEEISLVGTSRTIRFEPGMNAIIGSMSGGKTATVSCLRALLGADVSVVPELRGRTIAGTVLVGDRRFRIVRPLVTTPNAMVEIAEVAGRREVWRLPASQLQAGYDATFRDWWRDVLKLPRLSVPRAPNDDRSPLVPVTISDYLMYCVLRQKEIDSSVFGTPDNYSKNIKRKYVFEILYGLYDPEAAGLRDRLRQVTTELTALTADANTLERILQTTAFASRAELEVERQETERELTHARQADIHLTGNINLTGPNTVTLRERIAETEAEIARIAGATEAEAVSTTNLRELHGQLIAQSRRLTRALVAERLLNDFEFHTCPRCGAGVPDRGDEHTCRLCLQTPPDLPAPSSLAAEQDRVIEQVTETEELIVRSTRRLAQLQTALAAQTEHRTDLGAQLDRATSTYITDQADRIRSAAAQQARLEEHLARLDDGLALHDRLAGQAERVAELEREQEDLNSKIDATRHSNQAVSERLRKLDDAFEAALRSFDAPRFDDQPGSYINKKTYLPVVDGRPFADLQSQGVEVLVNVAHVLAHQHVALNDGDIPLPNILIIDGISSNVGHEGVDLERLRKMYASLLRTATEHIDRLQIIVTDNDSPPIEGIHRPLELSDTNRLVPIPPAEPGEARPADVPPEEEVGD
ncbi:hypothetical protein [Streptomyces nodosus]|uniref:Rad50/SbcC-type AAA domain-containing protein n=1 Tax=Streptomyces nodosus TaxID=40318 RepID=A0A0B5D629_9ACTN|nr:hypothetical protein [Streptomyces nodosus]AJE38693.1 hypothetical protein SNOD_00145 [Streptomyces nodosus]MBB4789395.1 Mg2+ and Co2+ transporter CorA [Streptomyces nodosus]QEV37270.1 hypothetical protein CP978_00505 [Streptomyces nodosus]